MKNGNEEQPALPPDDPAETGRREALLKIGKYGAYVAPAVLALVLGRSAEACSCA